MPDELQQKWPQNLWIIRHGQSAGNVARDAAEAAGLEYHYNPFTPGQITPEMISAQAQALASPGPKVAYCRSGNRSTVLWALSRAGIEPADQLIGTAAAAGYDISGLRPTLADDVPEGRLGQRIRQCDLGRVPAALNAVIGIKHVDDAGHRRLGPSTRWRASSTCSTPATWYWS